MFGVIKKMIDAWRDFPLRDGGTVANRYRIDRFLAAGSYGLAYAARDLHDDGRTVLLKQQRPSKGRKSLAYLQKEHSVLSSLEHSHIPRALDFFPYKNSGFMVTDFIAGKTIETLLFDEQLVFDRDCSLDMTIQVLDILQTVHANGFVHLDVRLPNLIHRNKEIYLVDFGLARHIGDHDKEYGDDHPYESGKLAYRHLAEPQSDLYAVGHLLLYLLYSDFSAAEKAPTGSGSDFQERSWQEELQLPEDLEHFLCRLLKISAPFETAAEALRVLKKIKNRSNSTGLA